MSSAAALDVRGILWLMHLQDDERGSVFDGIRTIAAFYLRADSSAICECIQNFGLNDLLFSVARLEMAFKKTLRSGLTQSST